MASMFAQVTVGYDEDYTTEPSDGFLLCLIPRMTWNSILVSARLALHLIEQLLFHS